MTPTLTRLADVLVAGANTLSPASAQRDSQPPYELLYTNVLAEEVTSGAGS